MEFLSKQLQEIGNSFIHINGGGCGEFALALGKKLKKNNIKFKYVLLNEREGSTIQNVREFNSLKKKSSLHHINVEGFNVYHIMIYVKGQFIDCTGVYNSLKETEWNYCKVSAILKEKTLKKLCENGGWNFYFDRDQIPDIKKRISSLRFS